MASWTDAVDLTCERLGPVFWAEPFNAIGNALFFVVGMAVARMARGPVRDMAAGRLALLLLLVGVAGFVHHTLATRITLAFDVLAGVGFLFGATCLALRRFFGWNPAASFAGSLALVATMAVGAGDGVTAAAAHVPALFALVTAAVALKVRAARLAGRLRSAPAVGAPDPPSQATAFVEAVAAPLEAARMVGMAAAILTLSAVLRAADLPLCPHFARGTHGASHFLEAIVGLLLIRSLIVVGPAGRSFTP